MLDEKNDGKMSKYNELCSNGGDSHVFDEYGFCFECDKEKDEHDLEQHFKKMFNAKSVTTFKLKQRKIFELEEGFTFLNIENEDGKKLIIGFFSVEDFGDE